MMATTEDKGGLPLLDLAKITMAKEAATPRARAHGRANKDFAGIGLGMVDALDMTSTTAATITLLI